MVARNSITGDFIVSKMNNDNYRDNYDAIFRKKEELVVLEDNTDKIEETDEQTESK